jgi:hypothetical protein
MTAKTKQRYGRRYLDPIQKPKVQTGLSDVSHRNQVGGAADWGHHPGNGSRIGNEQQTFRATLRAWCAMRRIDDLHHDRHHQRRSGRVGYPG